jgi:hypothetical protein
MRGGSSGLGEDAPGPLERTIELFSCDWQQQRAAGIGKPKCRDAAMFEKLGAAKPRMQCNPV